jgi:uncharacterized membrane protein
MSDLVVIAFSTEAKAEEVRQKLLVMQKEYLLELSDAVVAVKEANGKIKLNQMINTTAAGAVRGAFWGTLVGLIFLMLAGAALGAASCRRGSDRSWNQQQIHEGHGGGHPARDSSALRLGAEGHCRQGA